MKKKYSAPWMIAATTLTLTLSPVLYSQAKGDVTTGKAKYDQLCSSCHGTSGKGDGAAAAVLTPKPRNFADKAYMSGRTDADLAKVIKNGGPSTGLSAMMPPWGSSLTDAEISNVVAYIRTMAK